MSAQFTLMGINVKAGVHNNKLQLSFRYHEKLKDRIKTFDGAKWNPETKSWEININDRNAFQLDILKGVNRYVKYDEFDKLLISGINNSPFYNSSRPLFNHQREMKVQGLHIRTPVFACEMGTGKTLSAIEVIEESGTQEWWYVAPRSALISVKLQFERWNARFSPKFMTYEGLVTVMKNWEDGQPAPQGIIFDESSRLKNPNAQRSQAAKALADSMREEWNKTQIGHSIGPYIICMSGSPAPKDPTDWWNQCEIVEPGYIREGNIKKFKQRLSLTRWVEGGFGGGYPELVTWFDNENKCAECGLFEEQHSKNGHKFKKSVNEVGQLYNRLRGLVLIRLKKDCLDLPDKQYKIIAITPSAELQRTAQTIADTSPRAITALTLMRELSDGFQYEYNATRNEICNMCNDETKNNCAYCGGTGLRRYKDRLLTKLSNPEKIEVLKDLLDQYEDTGRVVIYAGFTASIDMISDLCQSLGWITIKADGRGWYNKELISFMDASSPRYMESGPAKLAFIGQPGAAGMGLTLTASPVIIYYSNDFNAESRIQSEDRIHRAGMDVNRGATIIDICHIPVDYLVLANLKKKRSLQGLTLGELKEGIRDDEIFKTTEIIHWHSE